jgi:hypothetical protein
MLALVAVAGFAARAEGQHQHADSDTLRRNSVGAMATALYSYLRPGPLSSTISESYLTQPMVFGTGRAWKNRVAAFATLNGEGATLQRGEINPGVYGEGYVDRRHPHTWVHEVMVGIGGRTGRSAWSLFAGKGFVPFGSDDPMTRPFVKYPVNHHQAQLLERLMVSGAINWRWATLEGASFNGDEPETPTDWPNTDRLFDSWSSRLTLRPGRGVEGSASVAQVKSPEFPAGFGLDQRKQAGSIRITRGNPVTYALVEYARTREYSGSVQAFAFDSWLAEGTASLPGAMALSLRVERTTRPEEERLGSFFRTVRPVHDFSIIGRTQWTNVTLGVAQRVHRWGPLSAAPFLEAGFHHPQATFRPAALDIAQLYGSTSLWLLSAGVRMHAGAMRPRFGRYADAF